MKKTALKGVVAVFIILSGIISCSDSESRLSPLLKQTTVILNIGLPPENSGAYDNTIWNRIRRFFVPEAIAQTAPAAFGSILVRVTGSDFGVMEQTFGGAGTISLSVPSGNLRQFEVTANVAPGDPSAALSFRGTTAANLPEGETVSVPVIMGLNETKIVAPDNVLAVSGPYNSTRRVVMFSDMSGAGWSSLTQTAVTSLGLSSGSFIPYDVSFDSRGRIYIANFSTIGIIRIDNINGTNFLQGSASRFYTGGAAVSSVNTVAVDRIRNVVYFATNAELYQSNLDGTNTQLLPDPASLGTNIMWGIDVDSAGMLYIVARGGTVTQMIKYNPYSAPPAQIGSAFTVTSTATPSMVFDILIQGQYIYVANVAGNAGNQILQLAFSNNAFTIVSSNGTRTTTPTGAGQFFGATRFIAIRNDGFIIMDSNQGTSPTDFDRVVSFNDLSFNAWTTYGSFNNSGNGDAVGLFRFFTQC